MSRTTENLAWLDLLRVTAAVAVVVLHIAAEPVVFVQDRDSPLWNAGNILDSLSRWCIGVFIMVSGALLLDPSKADSVGAFYTRRLRRILVPTLFWSAVFLALGARMTLPKATHLLWTGRPWYHMWYLFMIIGLYTVTPLLRWYVARTGAGLRWVVAILALASASAWDLHLSIQREPLPDIVPTMFIPYLGYYLIGYEIRRIAPVRLHPGWLWGALVVGAACTIDGTHALIVRYGPTRLGLYLYEYLSPNVILMSLAVFALASQATRFGAAHEGRRRRPAQFVAWAAPLTLGVYLWHPLIILGLRKLGLNAIETGSILGVLYVAVPTLVASFALTWVMSRVPLLRQTVGLR